MKSIKRIMENRYEGKTPQELQKIFEDKLDLYKKMLQVLNPETNVNFMISSNLSLETKLAIMDDLIECDQCKQEYDFTLKKGGCNENLPN